MSPELGILADDLTGATDTGLQFASAGHRTVVLLAGEVTGPVDVLVLDSDSRGHTEAEARREVAEAARRLKAAGAARMYKKVDSTGRGHLGAEIEVTLATLNLPMALVCPAFPPLGRTVRDGCIYVRGVPLDQSEFAHDPLWPATTASLADLLRRETTLAISRLPLTLIRQGPGAVGQGLQRLRDHRIRLVIADAEQPADLRCLIEAIDQVGMEILPVGSAGLAESLVRTLRRPPRSPVEVRPGAGPVLVVAGTVNRVGLGQVERLVAAGAGRIVLPIDRALRDPEGAAAEGAACLADALRAESRVVLALGGTDRGLADLASRAQQAGVTLAEATARLVQALGAAVRRALAVDRPAALVLTGGETARAVCGALGAGTLEVAREITPGIPLCRLLGGPHAGLPIVTKAGGFGDQDTLVMVVRALEGMRDGDE